MMNDEWWWLISYDTNAFIHSLWPKISKEENAKATIFFLSLFLFFVFPRQQWNHYPPHLPHTLCLIIIFKRNQPTPLPPFSLIFFIIPSLSSLPSSSSSLPNLPNHFSYISNLSISCSLLFSIILSKTPNIYIIDNFIIIYVCKYADRVLSLGFGNMDAQ